MATTTNYGWTTPDDTGLVKDGASAIRSLGTAIDTSVKSLNPGTTSGDIDYYTSSTAKTRLAKGTAGQVLTMNSGATAPEWATVSAGANWSLLNAGGTSLSGSQTVTISSISGKDKIMIMVLNASTASGNNVVAIRINTDTGSNYYRYGIYKDAANDFRDLGGAAAYAELGSLSANNGDTVSGTCLITGANAAGVKVLQVAGTANMQGYGGSGRANIYGGYYNSSSTVSSVSVYSSSGNFDLGTVWVYASA